MEPTMEQLLEALRLAGEALVRYETYDDLNLTAEVSNKVRGKNLGLALDIAVTRNVLRKMYVTAHLSNDVRQETANV
jgi:hypothetical protein